MVRFWQNENNDGNQIYILILNNLLWQYKEEYCPVSLVVDVVYFHLKYEISRLSCWGTWRMVQIILQVEVDVVQFQVGIQDGVIFLLSWGKITSTITHIISLYIPSTWIMEMLLFHTGTLTSVHPYSRLSLHLFMGQIFYLGYLGEGNYLGLSILQPDVMSVLVHHVSSCLITGLYSIVVILGKVTILEYIHVIKY